jgi:hypothetical protein
MPIAYDTAPEIEVVERQHDFIKIRYIHVSETEHDNELDWIKVNWSTGDSITTSERTASISSSGIANTTVEVTVVYVYDGLDTAEGKLTIDVPDVPKDPELYVDITSDDYVRIPQTDLYLDIKRLIYADAEGKLTNIVLPSDPNIEVIKTLIPEEKWKYLNERLVNNPYQPGTLVDLLTGLLVDQDFKVSGKIEDNEEKIKALKENWIKKIEHPDPLPNIPDPDPQPDDKQKAINTYVLSRKFYTGDLQNMTMFEKEVYKYIQGKQLDINILMDFYKEFPSWPTEEKYYKLPILVVMLKDYIASVRTEI